MADPPSTLTSATELATSTVEDTAIKDSSLRAENVVQGTVGVSSKSNLIGNFQLT